MRHLPDGIKGRVRRLPKDGQGDATIRARTRRLARSPTGPYPCGSKHAADDGIWTGRMDGLAKGTTRDALPARRKAATERAKLAVAILRDLGVEAKVTGSLARGTFAAHSDVDFLVVSCPDRLRYAIEGRVEDVMRDIPFDVVYLDEIPPGRSEGFTRDAVDASLLP